MFKKLKSLFIVEDKQSPNAANAGNQKAGNSNPAQGKKPAAPKTAAPDKEAIANNKDATPSEKFITRLLKALEENNIEGFDYLEYKQSLQNLSNVNMEEPTKFKSALAMATTMGASKDQLISTAQHYVKILQKEELKFQEAFKSQQSKQVEQREVSFKNMEAGIKKKEQQIAQLQKEIEEGKKLLNNKKVEVNKANAKVQATKENFYGSYNMVVNQIVEDIEKMKKYLE